MKKKRRTTKTEFCRWLNEHMGEIPELDGLFQKYLAGVQQQNLFGCRAGYWLHDKHSVVFRHWYRWWKKNSSLWGMIYDGCNAAEDPAILPEFKK
jgi:hypothetical protein